METRRSEENCNAWRPGLRSDLPRRLLPLSTVFRPENSLTTAETALELSDFTGLPPHSLIEFRVERLIVHELLIRVTADLSVPDGDQYEDLGKNFREMVSRILGNHIAPKTAEIAALFQEMRGEAEGRIMAALSALDAPDTAAPSKHERASWWARRLGWGREQPVPQPAVSREQRELTALAGWREQAQMADPLEKACHQALYDIASAVIRRQGRLIGDKRLIAGMALRRVCNRYGADLVGEFIDPMFRQAAQSEGFEVLPLQDQPVVMNVKGASASGKSTLRPLQNGLTQRLGLVWREFALISPDIWRKFLLDYDSLGDAYKYAGTLTGHEVAIIDERLDRHI